MVILCLSDVLLPRYEKKHRFSAFETGLTAFADLFFVFWWLVCVNLTYRWQDTCENVASPALKQDYRYSPLILAILGVVLRQSDIPLNTNRKVASSSLKPVLQHSPFFFEHVGGFFTSIGRTFAQILVKTLLHRLSNRFYDIRCFF